MSKKFTMLLMSLLCVMGVAWAQPEVGKEYRIKEANQNLYLTIQGYNQSNTGAKGSVPLLEKAPINADQVWTLEATDTENVYKMKSKSGYYVVQGGWNVDAHDNNANQAKVQFVSNGETYKIKNMHNGNQWWKSQNVGGTWYPFCDASEDAAASWTLEEVPADEFAAEVTLTITYNFNGNKVSESTVEKTPGAEYTIPTLDYTKIASYKIGEGDQIVTDGACTITVPNAATTVTVELASNFPFEVSTDYENATWYVLQIRSNNKKYVVRSESAPYANTTTTPTTEDALWAFVGNPFDGIQVLNKAAGAEMTLGLDGANGVMLDGTTTWNITKGNGGFLLRNGNEGVNYLHDFNSTLKIWADNGAATDQGSAFVVTSEAEMISLATTAMGLASKLDTYAESSYYTYPNAAVAEAKATLQGVANPTDFLTALQAKATVESVQAALNTAGKSGAPVAGDIIMLKNKNVNKYLIDNGENARIETANKENKALWEIVAGETGVKLKNYATGRFLGSMSQSQATATVEEETEAGEYTWTNTQDVYAAFNFVGSNQYGHESWSNLVGWYDKNANASQWVVTNVRPLSITYLYNGEELGASTEYVEYGTVYTVSSSYDFTKVSACTKNEEALEAVDGVFSFEVTEATTLTVELADDLPFEYAASVENIEHWYYMQMHNNPMRYIKRVDNELTWADQEVDENEKSSYAWAFVGDLINGFKVVNKAAGVESALLSTGNNADKVTLTTFDEATLLFVKPTRVNVNGYVGFCLKPASGNYMNAQDGTVKHWGDNDEGSTIKVTKLVSKHAVTIKQMFNGAQLGETTEVLVDEGSTYTFANPYANTNKFVTASCTANDVAVEEVEGQWSIEVTGPTSVVVTLAESNMPFNTTTITEGQFADDTEWYVLKQKTENNVWTYVAEGHTYTEGEGEDATEYTTNVKADAVAYNVYDDAQLWCFVGDALNGVKLFNKAAGAAMSLDNAAPAKLVANNDKTWELHKSTEAFEATDSRFGLKRVGGYYANLQEKLYESGNYVLNGWDLDAGSTTKAISATAELAEIATLTASLNELITKVTEFKEFVSTASAETLTTAIAAAQAVCDKEQPSKSELEAQISALNAAVDAVRYITNLDDLKNTVSYTVSANNRGAWYSEDERLNSTNKLEVTYSAEDANQQFAFLKSANSGKFYLYSVGKGKFVKGTEKDAQSNAYTALTENPEEYISFLNGTGVEGAFLWVVALNGSKHMGISNGFDPAVITHYNDKGDEGNKSRLEVAAAFNPTEALAKIEAYELAAIKAELTAKIAEARELAGKNFIGDDTKQTLNAAATTAEGVRDDAEATYATIAAQIPVLTEAILAAGYVTTVEGFSNNAVYTFLSNRSTTAYLMYDGTNDFVASQFKQTSLEVGADKASCQWAVYKSTENNYYMYNLGAQKFMGIETAANTGIPFSETPQTTTLKFKQSAVNTHPIMISSNGGQGTVNHSNNNDFTNNYGVVNWANNFGHTDDPGNVHKVAIVGALEESVLTTIANAVTAFEKQDAWNQLEQALAEATNLVALWDAGYYTTAVEEPNVKVGEVYTWRTANKETATTAEIKAKVAEVNNVINAFEFVAPAQGKFYRISYNFGTTDEPNVKYVQAKASGATDKENALAMTDDQNAASIFYYGADGKLLSYSVGLYVNESGTRGLQAVGAEVESVEFGDAAQFGVYKIKIGDYLHANSEDTNEDGVADVYFVDHCGSDAGHDEHNFTVVEVDMTDIFEELKPLAEEANNVAKLDYLSGDEREALIAEAEAITDGTITSDPTARVDAMINEAMDVMAHYDLSDQLFRLKQVASGHYMVFANPAVVNEKANDANQVFSFVATGAEGIYNLKSLSGLYMQVNSYSYKALSDGVAENMAHEMEYIGRGRYLIHTASGYVASDAIVPESQLWSNKGNDNVNAVWELEPVEKKTTVVYTLKHEGDVITTKEHSAYVGFAYPALETTYFGVTASGIPTDVITEEAIEEDGKIYVDITLTVGELPFVAAEDVDAINNWYFVQMHSNNNKYIQYLDGEAYIEWADADMDLESLDSYTWAFVGNVFEGFKLVNRAATVEKDGVKTLMALVSTGDGNPVMGEFATGTQFVLAASAQNVGFCLQYPKGKYLNASDGKVTHWSANDAGSTFLITERDLTGKIELQNLVNTVKGAYTAGEGVGYPTQASVDVVNSAIAAAEDALNGTMTADLSVQHMEAINNAVAQLEINLPKEGMFYTIQNAYTNNYMNVHANTGMKVSASAGMGELFQFVSAEDGKFYLYNVERGTYLSTAKAHNAGQNFAAAVDEDAAVAVTISNLGKANQVSIVPGNGATLHDDDYGTVLGWNDGKDSKSAWIITEVKPGDFVRSVGVGATGYSTLYLNYATIVPAIDGAGNGVFVASAVGTDNVSLAAVAAGAVLPAKTGVIIKAEASTTHSFAYTSEKGSVTSKFEGSLFNEIITPEANTTCYVLAKPAAEEGEEENPVGLYKATLNRDADGNKVTEDGVAFLNNANKIYLSVPGTQGARALTFRFGGTTDIETMETTDNGQQSRVIYDLTGRRINEIVEKGIYIVNGKKVVIK